MRRAIGALITVPTDDSVGMKDVITVGERPKTSRDLVPKEVTVRIELYISVELTRREQTMERNKIAGNGLR
jgi:hypothetical protein